MGRSVISRFLALTLFLTTTAAAGLARAHDFTITFADGCCEQRMEHCTARPNHPDPRCQDGHRAVDCNSVFAIDCIGVGCICDPPACQPDIPTGSVAEVPNGLDDDCDGFVDDEQCDGVDNDGDGSVDEDLGSCLAKFLFLPVCWDGTQQEFEQAARAQADFFFQHTGLDQCTDNFSIEFGDVSAFSVLSCSGFSSRSACEGSSSPLAVWRNEIQTNSLLDFTDFDMVAAFTNRNICGNIAGVNGGDFFWQETGGEVGVFAHELGHSFGLVDEYCSQPAGTTESRCNTGSPPAPPPPNWLGTDLGCDPNVGECCDPCMDYEICCLGNQNPASGRCIMSYANAPGPRAFCNRCLSHLVAPPAAIRRSPANPNGQVPLNCSFAHLGDTPLLSMQLSMTRQASVSIHTFQIGVGRLGLAAPGTSGEYGIEVLDTTGATLYASAFDLSFLYDGPTFSGVDYSNIAYAARNLGIRALLPAGVAPNAKLRVISRRNGMPHSSTTLNGAAPIAIAGSDRSVECNGAGHATVDLDGRASSDPDGDSLQFSWSGSGVTFDDASSATPRATIPFPGATLALIVSDGLLQSTPDALAITVTDTTAPTLTGPARLTLDVCRAPAADIALPPPVASDVCHPQGIQLTAEILESNGIVHATPIPLANGSGSSAQLTSGLHKIRWTARDVIGNPGALEQEVSIAPCWSMFHRSAQRDGHAPRNGPATNRVQWSFDTHLNVRSSPAIGADGTIYFGADDNRIHALAPDGSERWQFSADGDFQSSPAIGFAGAIYAGNDDGHLYALSAETGALLWKRRLGLTVRSSPAVSRTGMIFVGSNSDEVFAFQPSGDQLWSFDTDGDVRSSPAVTEDGTTVYIGSDSNWVFALDAQTGAEKWRFRAHGDVQSTPAIGPDGTVYVGSDDERLYALEPVTGALLFAFDADDPIKSSPAISPTGSVVFGTDDAVIAIDAQSGSLLWTFAAGAGDFDSSPAVGADGTVYIGSTNERVYALDGLTGTVLWQYKTSGDIRSSPAIGLEGTLYVGSDDDRLYAFGPEQIATTQQALTGAGAKVESGTSCATAVTRKGQAPAWVLVLLAFALGVRRHRHI